MDTSAIVSSTGYGASLAMIKSANRQPELALQLILKTTDSLDVPPASLQAAAPSVPAETQFNHTGRNIDIFA